MEDLRTDNGTVRVISIPDYLFGESVTYTVRILDEKGEAFWLEGNTLTVGWEMTDGQLSAVLSALHVARISGRLEEAVLTEEYTA